MRNFIYQFGVVVALIALVGVIYFTMGKAQSGELELTMSSLGDRLLNLVPDGEEREDACRG